MISLVTLACRAPENFQKPVITVAAASDLVKALPELGREFEGRTGVKVGFSLGASGILAQQISQGAPFDVFLSADRQYIEQLGRVGHVEPGSRRVYARGRLVLWSAKFPLARLEDLLQPQVRRISIANPGYAPYGRAARQALERTGMWGPRVVVAESIRHALEMAESGNVEVAITALSLITDAGGFTYTVPETLHDPLWQEAAVVARRPRPEQARAFVEYLSSPAARRILAKFGFAFPK